MSNASGLAAAIRSATESDTFDLAGQNQSTIAANVTSAFEKPLPLSEMIRITFVTGAGKLGRQKYDENAAKTLTSALRDLGFEEDRGASCVNECAGSFKLQHDTGKNLKTVVVFPKIEAGGSQDGDNEGESGAADNGESSSLFPKGSPKEMIALSSKPVFQNMVKSRCASWSQKKGCVAAISDVQKVLTEVEQKLLQGTPLSDAEQSFYDQVSDNDLQDKQAHVKEQMQQHVESGFITRREKDQLLAQVTERIATITQELETAEKNNQAKKVEKLKVMKEKALERKEKVSKISAKPPNRLKHEAEIFQLRKELQPLLELEDTSKGRLLSVKETQNLARKEDILEEIAQLVENSRGWFEDDANFQGRVEACNAAWGAQQKTKKAAPKSAGSSSRPTNAWATAGSSAKPRGYGAKSKSSAKKKSGKASGGGVFAAMMMDSDSD